MNDPTVIILVGAPGCGKSTWAAQHLIDRPEGVICSADNYFTRPDGSYQFCPAALGMAHAICMAEFEASLLYDRSPVIVDNTSTRKSERTAYTEKAKASGYRVFLKVFREDPTLCAARCIHGVPLSSVQKMSSRIDVDPGFYEV